MKHILIVGLGNLLLRDDGIGIRVLDELERLGPLPPGVQLIHGETGGLSLLPMLDDASAIIFIDAADFGGDAGEIQVFRGDRILTERSGALSAHDVGLKDVVSLLSLGSSPMPELVVVGIQPAEIEVGLEVSAAVSQSVPRAIAIIHDEVERLHERLSQTER
jgi:hydrogenase maturation protease